MNPTELPLRIVLEGPPKDVTFALQKGKEPDAPVRSKGKSLAFALSATVKEKDGALRLLGPFVQGPPAARFVYVNSGTYAGDKTVPDGRRAKVPLSLSRELIESALEAKGAVLEARIAGTAKDGGAACASVPLLDGWKLSKAK